MDPAYVSLSIGSFMLLATVPCVFCYYHILSIITKDKSLRRKSSYRLMLAIGVTDLTPCFAHLITGLYTIFNKEIPSDMGKLLGVAATPSYVMYTVLTLVLAFNRLLQAYNPETNSRFFSGHRVFIWIGGSLIIWLFFAITLSMPIAAISYELSRYVKGKDQQLARYSWRYDESLPWSSLVKKVEMYIELSSILLSAMCYGLVLIIYSKKKILSSFVTRQHFEAKLLVQSVVITVYCTVLNVFWHNSTFLPTSIITDIILNFMWIVNSWVYPLIYFIAHKTIRENTLARVRSIANTTTGSAPEALSLSQIRIKKSPVERTLGTVPQMAQDDPRSKPLFIT